MYNPTSHISQPNPGLCSMWIRCVSFLSYPELEISSSSISHTVSFSFPYHGHSHYFFDQISLFFCFFNLVLDFLSRFCRTARASGKRINNRTPLAIVASPYKWMTILLNRSDLHDCFVLTTSFLRLSPRTPSTWGRVPRVACKPFFLYCHEVVTRFFTTYCQSPHLPVVMTSRPLLCLPV